MRCVIQSKRSTLSSGKHNHFLCNSQTTHLTYLIFNIFKGEAFNENGETQSLCNIYQWCCVCVIFTCHFHLQSRRLPSFIFAFMQPNRSRNHFYCLNIYTFWKITYSSSHLFFSFLSFLVERFATGFCVRFLPGDSTKVAFFDILTPNWRCCYWVLIINELIGLIKGNRTFIELADWKIKDHTETNAFKASKLWKIFYYSIFSR